jgi:hypothetical protein
MRPQLLLPLPLPLLLPLLLPLPFSGAASILLGAPIVLRLLSAAIAALAGCGPASGKVRCKAVDAARQLDGVHHRGVHHSAALACGHLGG